MKVVITDFNNPLYKEITPIIIKELIRLGNEVIYYKIIENSLQDFYIKTSHFQMFELIIDYCNDIKADYLYFNFLFAYPEYLLSELKVKKIKFKIGINFEFRQINKSLARSNTIKELMYYIDKCIINNLAGPSIEEPENWKKVNPDKNKYIITHECMQKEKRILYNKEKKESKKMFGINNGKFIIASFGYIKFAKGYDILFESLNYLNEDYRLLLNIHEDFKEKNGLNFEKIKNNNKIILNIGYMAEEKIGYFISAANVIVLPYRKAYLYGSSNIPGVATMARRPIIVPDFVPFNNFINKYKTGLLFKSENPKSLANKIIEMKERYFEICSKAKYDLYFEEANEWKNFAKIICNKI